MSGYNAPWMNNVSPAFLKEMGYTADGGHSNSIGTRDTYDYGNGEPATSQSSSGFGMGDAAGIAEAVLGLGKLGLGYQDYKLQKEKFAFDKLLNTNKFNASATEYNAGIDRHDAINNALTARRKGLGDVNASYTNKTKIAKM